MEGEGGGAAWGEREWTRDAMAGVLGVGIGVEDVRYALEPSSPGPVRPDALGRSKKPFRVKKTQLAGW